MKPVMLDGIKMYWGYLKSLIIMSWSPVKEFQGLLGTGYKVIWVFPNLINKFAWEFYLFPLIVWYSLTQCTDKC